jgi:hypothetical protein
MAEDQSEQRTCDLRVVLFRYRGVNTSYDATAGLKREFVLSGRVDDPYLGGGPDFSAPHFHNKLVRVKIHSPPDPEWLGEVLGTPGAESACGVVLVNANVEPKRFELDGETVEEEPVQVWLKVSPEVFEALRRQTAEAYEHRRIMAAKVTLLGTPLPKLDSYFIFLKDLDVSVRRTYAVRDFEISDT